VVGRKFELVEDGQLVARISILDKSVLKNYIMTFSFFLLFL